MPITVITEETLHGDAVVTDDRANHTLTIDTRTIAERQETDRISELNKIAQRPTVSAAPASHQQILRKQKRNKKKR